MTRSPWTERLALGGLLLLLVLPLVPLVLWSVGFRWFFPELLPGEWSLRAWAYLASPSSRVGQALFNSLIVGLGATLLSLAIALPAGRALGLYSFRGKRLVEFLLLAPTIVPLLAVAMGIHIAFIRYGLADTRLGVALVHLVPTLPYAVLILASVFAGYDVAYEAQARTLGASPWQVLRHVMWPAIRPGLAVAALFAFLISWSQYLLTLLIGGGQVMTLPVLLVAFATSGDNALTAALSLVLVAPALLFLLLASRSLSSGQETALGGLGRI